MEKVSWEGVRQAETAAAEKDLRRQEQVGPRMAELPDLLRELNVRGEGDGAEAKALREKRLALEREDQELREEGARLASWAADARETLLRDEAREVLARAREVVDQDLARARLAAEAADSHEAAARRARQDAEEHESLAHATHDAGEVLARVLDLDGARTGRLAGKRGPLRRQLERGDLVRATPAALRTLRERDLLSAELAELVQERASDLDAAELRKREHEAARTHQAAEQQAARDRVDQFLEGQLRGGAVPRARLHALAKRDGLPLTGAPHGADLGAAKRRLGVRSVERKDDPGREPWWMLADADVPEAFRLVTDGVRGEPASSVLLG